MEAGCRRIWKDTRSERESCFVRYYFMEKKCKLNTYIKIPLFPPPHLPSLCYFCSSFKINETHHITTLTYASFSLLFLYLFLHLFLLFFVSFSPARPGIRRSPLLEDNPSPPVYGAVLSMQNLLVIFLSFIHYWNMELGEREIGILFDNELCTWSKKKTEGEE